MSQAGKKDSKRLGRLVIAWGPASRDRAVEAHYKWESFSDGSPIHSFESFHANALNDDPDPFASQLFGVVVKSLLSGATVIVTDSVFDDARRRRIVERAFRQTLPELLVEQALIGPPPGDAEADPAIRFDDDVYGESLVGYNETIVVQASASPQVLVSALSEAAARMMRVDTHGTEWVAVPIRGLDLQTPNYASDVRVFDDGSAGFYIDCKGAIEPPMAAQFRQILRQELERRGVFEAHIRVPT